MSLGDLLIRHDDPVEFVEQLKDHRILVGEYLVGLLDPAGKPGWISSVYYTSQVRAYVVAKANGVATGALIEKNLSALLGVGMHVGSRDTQPKDRQEEWKTSSCRTHAIRRGIVSGMRR